MRRILAAGFASAALYLLALGVPDWGRDWPRFAPLHALLILSYVGAVWGVRGESGRTRDPSRPNRERRLLWLLWGGAIVFRALVLVAPPTLSDDLYRYLWDGKVLLAGMNPYRYPPSAPELAGLRDALWPLINNPALPTIYPPLLMLVFAAGAGLARGASALFGEPLGIPTAVLTWKALAVIADLAAGVAIQRGLRALGRSPLGALLYLWHPLVVLEFAGSGHADAFGVLLVALAFWGAAVRRDLLAGVCLTLGGLVKFLPWAALPALVPRLRLRWILLPLLLLAFYLPFARAGVGALGSLGVFAATWRANDFLHAFLPGAGAGTEAGTLVARRLALALSGTIVLVLVWRRRGWPEVYAWGVGFLLLFSPVVHPWYVIWLLPAAIFLPHPAWWVWSLTVGLAYAPLPAYRAGGAWTESLFLKGVEYLPVLVVIGVQAWRESKRRETEGGSAGERSLPIDSPGWWDRS